MKGGKLMLNEYIEKLNYTEKQVYEKMRELKRASEARIALNFKRNEFENILSSIYKKLKITGRLDLIAGKVETMNNKNISGIRKISQIEAKRLIEKLEPKGLFYCIQHTENGKLYLGIDNKGEEAWVEEFPSWHKCKRWLLGGEKK